MNADTSSMSQDQKKNKRKLDKLHQNKEKGVDKDDNLVKKLKIRNVYSGFANAKEYEACYSVRSETADECEACDSVDETSSKIHYVNVVTKDELCKIWLSRDKLEKWVKAPFFEKTVIGCFVRLWYKGDNDKNKCMVAEIEDVLESNTNYQLGQTRTNKAIKLKHFFQDNVFKMEYVSNSCFTDFEFEMWKSSSMRDNFPLPNQDDISRKLKDIQIAGDDKSIQKPMKLNVSNTYSGLKGANGNEACCTVQSETVDETSSKIQKVNVVTKDELCKIWLSRDKLERWVKAPFFKKTVIGCFVRLWYKGDNGKYKYMVAEIADVCRSKMYQLGQTRTNKAIKLKHFFQERIFKIEDVSNSRFTDFEFEFWKLSSTLDNFPLPNQDDITRKLKDIQKAEDDKNSRKPVKKLKISDIYSGLENANGIEACYSVDETSSKTIQDVTVVTKTELCKIWLSRDKLERWIYAPFFTKTVIGCFVRLWYKSDDGTDKYRVAEIEDVLESTRNYQLGHTRTNKALKIKNYFQDQVFGMDYASNSHFSDSEFEMWKFSSMIENFNLPTPDDITRKLQDIQIAMKEEDDSRKTMWFKEPPQNDIMQKTQLMINKKLAKSMRNLDDIRRYIATLEQIEEKSKLLDKMRNNVINNIKKFLM